MQLHIVAVVPGTFTRVSFRWLLLGQYVAYPKWLKEIKNNYSKRHYYILEKISSELKHHCDMIYVNKTIKTAFPEILEESTVLNLKPDIVVKQDTDVSIIDIACPYDLFIESAYQAKLEKYKCIKEFLSNRGIECNINAIIIGSLGTVHNQALKVLLKH